MGSKHIKRSPVHKHGFAGVSALLVGVLISCFALPLAAQYRGTIRGVVSDSSGAVVPDAKVTLRNVETNVAVTQETNSSGLYLFNLVQPGTYNLAINKAGFQKYVQNNINVMTTSDVTVNAALKVGNVAQTVTVTGQKGAHVEFNTSTMKMTIEGTNLANLPILARNPFTLALLDAGVVNRYWDVAHRNPFYMWSDTQMDIGGPTKSNNEILLDGTPLNVFGRGSYNAPMDAVKQVVVMENTPDARYGFGGGGTLNLAMKNGTNQWHGDAYYFGRQPSLNAITNRITRDKNLVKQNIYGGTLGNPVVKNKVFNFFAFELWHATQPSSVVDTMPTAAEKNGDFSGALTPSGAQRVIYDPMTTVFNPGPPATVTRQPFPGNIIPPNRIDPTAQKLMSYLWAPNNAGDDPSGLNNFKKAYPWWTHYWNLSDRVDYNLNDNWRLFGRFSKFQTRLDNVNWGNSIAVPSDNGGLMDALNSVMDVVWMVNPRTVVDFNVGVIHLEDDYASTRAQVSPDIWAGLWPDSNWYNSVLNPDQGIYFPSFRLSGNGNASVGGHPNWWLLHERAYIPAVNVSHEMGKHSFEFGWQWRHVYGIGGTQPGPGSLDFNSVDTGNTFLKSYNSSQTGDMWASALLGVVNGGKATIYPNLDLHDEQVALYAQDNYHLSHRITLNLGVRWERETGPLEEQHQLVRTLDLSRQIPELQGLSIPQICSGSTCIPQMSYQFNGAMEYTNASKPRMYDAPWNTFLPRVGIAVRINDKTAFRAGYARYAVPWMAYFHSWWTLPTNGYGETTSALGPLAGNPRAMLSDPYPTTGANINPIVAPAGNSLGRYTDLGNGVLFWNSKELKTPTNDRFNIGIQHQAPFQLFTQATLYMAFEHNAQALNSNYFDLNQMDPNLAYTYKGLVDQKVPNPFYNLLPADKMPGSLRLQPTVSARQLLKPYPQYENLFQMGWPGFSDHYYSLALQANRPMSQGLTAVVAYSYTRENLSDYFNEVDNYHNHLTMLDRGSPRHNLRFGGTYMLPFGRGRQYANHVNKLLDAVIGGWGTSQLLFWRSGDLLMFGPAMVNSDPTENIPTGYYFNPSAFQKLPSYTERTNPHYYPGLRGPNWWELDSSFFKTFDINERAKFELRMELYNMPNAFMPSDPNVRVGSGSMGRSTWVAGGNYGREAQFMGRIIF